MIEKLRYHHHIRIGNTGSGASETMYYYGDFYTLSGVPCRSTLEIVVDPHEGDRLVDLSWIVPDASVVMANPGSSRPTNGGNGNERTPNAIGPSVNLVEARRDSAQVQVEAIMERMGYKHVRILNACDVRHPSLMKLGKSLSCTDLGDSVFACPARTTELAGRLKPNQVVIAAWGYVDSRPLVIREKAAYDHILHCGCELVGSAGRFAHPGRKGATWVDDVVAKLPSRSSR